MSTLAYGGWALAAGVMIPVMAALNGSLGRVLGSAAWAAAILFGVGLIATLGVALTSAPLSVGGVAQRPSRTLCRRAHCRILRFDRDLSDAAVRRGPYHPMRRRRPDHDSGRDRQLRLVRGSGAAARSEAGNRLGHDPRRTNCRGSEPAKLATETPRTYLGVVWARMPAVLAFMEANGSSIGYVNAHFVSVGSVERRRSAAGPRQAAAGRCRSSRPALACGSVIRA